MILAGNYADLSQDPADFHFAGFMPSGGEVGPGERSFNLGESEITFAASVPGKRAGILSAEEGRFVEGRWENIRWLGGDQTHQGRHVRLEPGRFSIQRVKLYLY